MDGDSTTALPNAGKEGANENVQYAAPHSLDPVHVDEKELHAGHDQPGEIQDSGQNMSLFLSIKNRNPSIKKKEAVSEKPQFLM